MAPLKPKHVIVVTTSYPIKRDGSESAGSFVSDFVGTLGEYTAVTVVAPGTETKRQKTKDRVNLITYRSPAKPLSLLKPYRPKDMVAILQVLRDAAKALSLAISQRKPDHLFALWVLPSGWLAMRAARRHRILYSTWALGSDVWTLGRLPFVKSLLRRVLRKSHTNFADGMQLREDVARIGKAPCLFLPSTRAFAGGKDKAPATRPPYRLAFLGRWHPNKGVDLLCDALHLLNRATWQRIREVRISGGGPLAALVNDRTRALRAEGRAVTVGGFLPKSDAEALFRWADFVLIPSRIESIPVVFSDAVKSQCPVIAMPVGDLPRLIAGYNVGVLANDVSAASFAGAIDRATLQPPRHFADGISEAAKAFDMERIVSAFVRRIGLNRSE